MDPEPSLTAVESRILRIRGQRVMLDSDLAEIYRVPTKVLKRAVRRNNGRFPQDFMLPLTPQEVENLRCQSGTSSWGGHRHTPYAFTEHGAVMLASVLKSPTAVAASIQIVRAFNRMRRIVAAHKDLSARLDRLERGYGDHDEKIKAIFKTIRDFLQPPAAARPRIGFRTEEGEKG